MEMVIFPFLYIRQHGFYEWNPIYLYSVCDHGIPDINVDFFFLKQCEYIQRNTIFSGNVHEARAYPPTRNLFTENTSS